MMGDLVNLAETREARLNALLTEEFRFLTDPFLEKAAAVLAKLHPELEIVGDDYQIALKILAAFLCKDASRVLLIMAKGEAGTRERFKELCATALPTRLDEAAQ